MNANDIQEGFEVFAHDGDVAFGAVREIAPRRKPEFVVYVENAGDFVVPFSAVVDADYRRVVRLLPGGSTAEMAERTRVDRAVHDGETAVGYRMRVARAEGDVAEVVREVARKCEALVRKAVGAYRAAVARGAER